MKAGAGVALLVLALAAGGGAYQYFAAAKPAAPQSGGPAPVPVALAQATVADLPQRLQVVGRAEAYDTVTLRARIDGQVAAVAYIEGQHVETGAVLVRLDPADFAARLRQVEAALARDQAQVAKVRQDVLRYESLKQKGFVSDEKVAEIRTNLAAQESTVKADQAAVDLARLQLDYATVRAPIAGVVGARLVSAGAAVKTNDTVLAVINRVKPLYASFAVPEKYLPRLRAAMRGNALNVAVSVPGTASAPLAGSARFIDNAVDAATGTIQMKAVLTNAEESLTPGQFLNVAVDLDVLRAAVVIPAEALQQGQDGPFVFVVGADHAVQPRKIEVAAIQSGSVAVAKGLQAGERVVTDGQLRLSPGVKVKEAGAAAGGAKPASPKQ